MPCPTADLKLALSSFLRVQFHGCHFALGVGAFLTPQCGFYKFHQPAPAPSSSSNTTTRRRCLHTICCWWLRSGIYRHFCRPKLGHLSRLVAIGMPPFGWMAAIAQHISGLHHRPCLYNGQSRPFQTCMKLASINTQMNTFN